VKKEERKKKAFPRAKRFTGQQPLRGSQGDCWPVSGNAKRKRQEPRTGQYREKQ